jgi:hypothetical protein
MPEAPPGYVVGTRREDDVMPFDDDELEVPEVPEDVTEQPADPFEPEAPAHVDPDAETIVHDEDVDDEAVVDEADPSPGQPG